MILDFSVFSLKLYLFFFSPHKNLNPSTEISQALTFAGLDVVLPVPLIFAHFFTLLLTVNLMMSVCPLDFLKVSIAYRAWSTAFSSFVWMQRLTLSMSAVSVITSLPSIEDLGSLLISQDRRTPFIIDERKNHISNIHCCHSLHWSPCVVSCMWLVTSFLCWVLDMYAVLTFCVVFML